MSHAETGRSIEHVFTGDETLWFLSQIYYGDGSQYTRIMEANHIESSEHVREGKRLVIPSPLFTPEQPGFAVRVAHLREKRAEALAKRGVASEAAAVAGPWKTVVIPISSPIEKAKEELGGR